jgi:predicted NBD/HSP70 family sugar kinase
MTETLFAVGDCGATHNRIAIVDQDFVIQRQTGVLTDVACYENNPDQIARVIHDMADGRKITAATFAIAAAVNEEGVITQAGDLTSWTGRSYANDIATALDLPPERSGILNDIHAAALGEQKIDHQRGLRTVALVLGMGSGFGGAKFTEQEGYIIPDEPGHEYLRDGAVCPCGGEGHVEAFLSGKGVALNHGQSLEKWLENRDNQMTYRHDLTNALMDLIERQDNKHDSNPVEDIRWTGSVALGQQTTFRIAEQKVFRQYYEAPYNRPLSFTAAHMGPQAGLYGAFVHAQQLAEAA